MAELRFLPRSSEEFYSVLQGIDAEIKRRTDSFETLAKSPMELIDVLGLYSPLIDERLFGGYFEGVATRVSLDENLGPAFSSKVGEDVELVVRPTVASIQKLGNTQLESSRLALVYAMVSAVSRLEIEDDASAYAKNRFWRDNIVSCASETMFHVTPPPRWTLSRFFIWTQNSCFFDSLMASILVPTSYWRNAFKRALSNPEVFLAKSSCKNRVGKQASARAYWFAKKTMEMWDVAIRGEQPQYCTDLRSILRPCLSEKEAEAGSEGDPGHVYQAIADLFPTSLKKRFPVNGGGLTKQAYGTVDTSVFALDLAAEAATSELDLVIDWAQVAADDAYKSLVFVNESGGRNLVKEFRNPDEQVVLDGTLAGKVRVFDEFILDDSFVLTAVILHQNRHYTAYLRQWDGRWYYYDDTQVGRISGSTATLPDEAWGRTRSGLTPKVFIYSRVD